MNIRLSGDRIIDGLPKLAGRDLAYWCQPGEACHADVLLDLAAPLAA